MLFELQKQPEVRCFLVQRGSLNFQLWDMQSKNDSYETVKVSLSQMDMSSDEIVESIKETLTEIQWNEESENPTVRAAGAQNTCFAIEELFAENTVWLDLLLYSDNHWIEGSQRALDQLPDQIKLSSIYDTGERSLTDHARRHSDRMFDKVFKNGGFDLMFVFFFGLS